MPPRVKILPVLKKLALLRASVKRPPLVWVAQRLRSPQEAVKRGQTLVLWRASETAAAG